jgi:hypothetical protein
MMRRLDDVQFYLCRDVVDIRKQYDALYAPVVSEMKADPRLRGCHFSRG